MASDDALPVLKVLIIGPSGAGKSACTYWRHAISSCHSHRRCCCYFHYHIPTAYLQPAHIAAAALPHSPTSVHAYAHMSTRMKVLQDAAVTIPPPPPPSSPGSYLHDVPTDPLPPGPAFWHPGDLPRRYTASMRAEREVRPALGGVGRAGIYTDTNMPSAESRLTMCVGITSVATKQCC
ncbi:hypothetical protein GGS23DRAFT_71880 [Durotheca rogersii]|uniref:uncharacterized protein n=1 Tax=Durotheca rogersii TaxID=419775 RepID=UPI00222074D9|nr:uncharacterized protein GGS23DRAFT_71880 [Durotheca rogersii]KAI5862850.1 hypothetical protein GGS23DRAFT_71880 [Durotheca rogersii]